ncbi:hypothetical protein TNCV_2023901 [Trichonephila clavipes]|nr:hypothetical protein TNCV_2023901 [Trichonephila clavipes]
MYLSLLHEETANRSDTGARSKDCIAKEKGGFESGSAATQRLPAARQLTALWSFSVLQFNETRRSTLPVRLSLTPTSLYFRPSLTRPVANNCDDKVQIPG